MNRVLIANRGEIAVRIAHAARELGWSSVAVHPADDAGLHARTADAAVLLPGVGPSAYLDAAAIVDAAVAEGASYVHPGYGFLSEVPALAVACEDAGLTLVGPGADALSLLGDKARAREFAASCGVPVTPGIDRPTTLAQARAFLREHGPTMLKALAGGGGRGMAACRTEDELDRAYQSCAREALASFGNGDLYVEKLVHPARHIEVQIVGDGTGAVTHLWERDCSVQRRHQKVVEVAPSPQLDAAVRTRILEAALTLAARLRYRGVGTFEFLVAGSAAFFMEANPRLQVEHTITEEITGVDLVRTQLEIAAGARLADLGLEQPPAVRGSAIQVRINAETLDAQGRPIPAAGTLTAFTTPSGPGVRVDTGAYAGLTVSPRYDSLLAKIITRGADFPAAARRSATALAELGVAGVDTNRALGHAVVTDPDFLTGRWDTDFIGSRLDRLSAHSLPQRAPRSAEPEVPQAAVVTVPDGASAMRAAMAGVVAEIAVEVGDTIAVRAPLLVLDAMKMEHAVLADTAGTVSAVTVAVGDLVEQGAVLAIVEPLTGAAAPTASTDADAASQAQDDWSPEVAEIERRRRFAEAMGGPAKIARQHDTGRSTVRERLDLLADPGTFAEIGALAGFARRDADLNTVEVMPTNFIGGTLRLDGRRAVVGADDFTVRGGAGDAAIHEKQIWLERYANEMRLPMIRLLDGQSGGGSVKMAVDAGYTYVPINPGWDAVVDSLSVIPVVAAALGPTVGLGAARLVMSHLSVLVDGVGQLFTAGPPLVGSATGEKLSKEELGGARVHAGNGTVERIVASEAEATAVIRRFLSYLPTSVYELPPVVPTTDDPARAEPSLLSAIPRNKRRPYAVEPILDAVFDADSVFRYAEYGAGTVTALARLDGHPVGVIAADPFQGATMTVAGALAVTRLVDLCETFHLPIISLTDQAGMSIGSAAERQGTIRHGVRALSAIYQARVPQAELILRRVYGVGGAGIVNRHRPGRSWAWPSGDWGSLPVQGGVEAAFGARIAAAADPAAEAEALRREIESLGSPFRTAERFGVQDIIDPRTSRALLCDWVHDAYRLLPEYLGRPSFGTRP
ncbi:carboxyl transferase domain-containing protein [Gordonia sp. (in: high G+C Gram-positive bacteria)]|uniref:acetyl-CoA carboxylase family protein n=1 Tax=Gordonia sp. (in: high G+C Gram-positive bacteria) TaxID=84139 RepID=UPI003C776439